MASSSFANDEPLLLIYMDMQLIGFLALGFFVITSIFLLPLKNLCMHRFSYASYGYYEKLFKLSLSFALCFMLINPDFFLKIFDLFLLGIYMINDLTMKH